MTPQVLLILGLGAGALLLATRKKRRVTKKVECPPGTVWSESAGRCILAPTPGEIPEVPVPSKLPTEGEAVAFDVYPTGAEATAPMPPTPSQIGVADDCSVLSVPTHWWEVVAPALFDKYYDQGARQFFEITDAILTESLGDCWIRDADDKPEGIVQFYEELGRRVSDELKRREDEPQEPQPTKFQQQ